MTGIMMVLFLSAASSSEAQQIQINSYRSYDTKKGLASLNVRKIVQDKYGFIWCATQDGLSRFDGRSFVNFSANTTDRRLLLKGADVFDLLLDDSGDELWALTTYGALNRISITKCRVIDKYDLQQEDSSHMDFWYKCIKLCNGFIYVGTDQGVLLKYSIAKKKTIAQYNLSEAKVTKGPIDELLIDRSNVWMFSSGTGIVVVDTGSLKKTVFIDGAAITGNLSKSFFFYDNVLLGNLVFVGTDIGLRVIDTKSFKLISSDKTPYLPTVLHSSAIRCLACTGDELCIAGEAGLFHVKMGSSQIKQVVFSKNIENKPWFELSNALLLSSNSLWIATQYGILNTSLTPSAFTIFNSSLDKKDIKIQHSMTLLSVNDSMIYTCADDGLYLTNQANGVIRKVIKGEIVYAVFKKDETSYIASGSKSLTLLNERGQIKNIDLAYPELKPIKEVAFITTAAYKDSLFFLASLFGYGVYIWDVKHKTIKQLNATTTPALQSNTINRLYFDSQQRLWIICDNCFSIYNPVDNSLYNFNIPVPGTTKPIGINMDICETQNRFWVASYGTGILELNKANALVKIWGAETGINNLGLYKIAAISDTELVVSSNNGLTIVNTQNNRYRNYFETDGLNTDNFEETSGDIYQKTLFFGGLNGFTRIEPSKLTPNVTPPTVFFTKLSYSLTDNINRDTSDLTIATINIPSNASQTSVYFTGLNYANPELTIFAYKITELHKDWIKLATQNFVTLVGLNPGTYHLQVRAANEDGIWSEPKELILVFLPKWYQTWWFYLLVALTVAAMLYALYRYRISQIKKQHEIRKNIATDLHDDLGSTLNSVKVFTNLAISGIKQEESLQQVKDNLTEATMSLRDMIWVLDDSLDTVDELVIRLKQFAIPVAAASNMEAVIKADSEVNSRQLTKEEKRNLFLICKEAVNNSIKYSGGTQISIHIKTAGKKIQIIISDNGKGFDEIAVKKGYGLKNMQYRAEQIKYSIRLVSLEGEGTEITISQQ